MAKIVIIGAGSGFGGRLSVDILSREALQHSTICLCDIHPGRLKSVTDYVQRTIDKYNLPTRLESSTDRRKVLAGADFVVTSISVGGGAYYGFPYNVEIEVPRKYGVDQAVGDTVGPGAVFRFLRTGPVQQQILRDMEELCPNALVLNHTNPMCMLTWLHSVGTSIANVGLCHGVQATTRKMAKLLDVPYEETNFLCAGINHLAWVLDFHHGKEDLYPRLRALIDQPDKIEGEEVRFEIFKHFGVFSTESNRHDSEYMPYFRRTEQLRGKFDLESREVGMTVPSKREWMTDSGDEEDQEPVGELKLSHEYSSGIMEAVVTNEPYRFNGNVMNHGLIGNLPQGCCVEVPCMVDSQGVNPCHVPDLPAQLAAIDRTNINVQELAVQAVLERDKEAAFHACCLDPLTASVLSLDNIRAMFEEMWEAEASLLKHFDPNHRGPLPETCAE